MGHIVGEDIVVARNEKEALKKAKLEWSNNADFINSYEQENIANQIRINKIIKHKEINENKKIYKKNLKTVKNIIDNNRPRSNSANILCLGTFAWDRYEGNLLGKTETSKRYKVICGFDKDYIEEFKEDLFDLKEFRSKKEVERYAMEKGFENARRKKEVQDINNYYKHTIFDYESFLENFPKDYYFAPKFETKEVFILNENNEIINQVKITITQKKNQQKQLKSYNKQVIPLKAYAITFDAYVG